MIRSGKTVDPGFLLPDEDEEMEEKNQKHVFQEPKKSFSLGACFPSFSVPGIKFCTSSNADTEHAGGARTAVAVDSMDLDVEEETNSVEEWLAGGENPSMDIHLDFQEFEWSDFDSDSEIIPTTSAAHKSQFVEYTCSCCKTKKSFDIYMDSYTGPGGFNFTCSVCQSPQKVHLKSFSEVAAGADDDKISLASTQATSNFSDFELSKRDCRIVDTPAGQLTGNLSQPAYRKNFL